MATQDILRSVPPRAILATGLGLIASLVAAAVLVLSVLRNDALERESRHLGSLAAVASEQMRQSIQSVDLIIDATVKDVEGRHAGKLKFSDEDLLDSMRKRVGALLHVRNLLVIGGDGAIRINSQGLDARSLNFSDRDYFQVHRERPTGGVYAGAPVASRITGEQVQVFSRRVGNARGGFEGVVAGTVRMSYFDAEFAAIGLGAGGRVALFRADGLLLLSYPASAKELGRSFADRPVFQEGLASAAGLTVRRAGLFDGEPRIVAFRPLKGYPLMLAVAAMESTVLGGWRRDAWQIGGGAAGAALLIGAVLYLLMRQRQMSAELRHDLVESGARLQGIIQSAMDAIITVDEKQDIVFFNDAAEKIFRCRAEDAIGGPLGRFIPARFREAHHAHLESFAATGATKRRMGLRQSLFGLRADGEEFPIDASISQMVMDGKHFYTVILRDSTDRLAADVALERSHRELREAGERLHAIIHSAMDAIVTIDQQHTIVLFNEAAERIFLCKSEEAVGQTLDRFIPERFRSAHREHVENFGVARVTTRRMGGNLVLAGLRANGEEFPIDASISQVTVEGRKLYTVILRDITQRVRAEAELRRQRDTAQRYLDIVNVMLVALDTEGKVTLINGKVCEVLGCREEEIMGQPWIDRFVPERQRADTRKVYAQIASGDTQMAEFHENQVLTRSGIERTIAWHNRVLTSDDGRFGGTLSSGMDITERRAAEEALKRSFDELRELSAAMHEVREAERLRIARELHDELAQWLTALKMDVSWLSSRLPRDQAPLVEKTEKMKALVDTTVASVRRIAADLRPVMLDDLGLVAAMEHLLHDLSERTGMLVGLDVGSGDLDFGEPLSTALYRMTQEALTNVARHADATEARVGIRIEDGKLVLVVRDNGRGYDEMAAAARKSYGIIGIRERAHTLGGAAHIERQAAGGTQVTIVIPLARYRSGEMGK